VESRVVVFICREVIDILVSIRSVLLVYLTGE